VALVLLGAFVASLVALLLGMRLPAYAEPEDESLLVYCLSPAQRTGLSDAAVALGLAVRDNAGAYELPGGRKLDPASWHRDHLDDFTRTCDALSAAQRAPGPGVFASVLPFLTGLVSAVLAFSAATWRDRVSRGRTLADDLRSSFEEFHQAAEQYLGGRGPEEPKEMEERGGTLLMQLARAKAAHPRWAAVRTVESELEGMGLDSPARDRQEREKVTARLETARDTVFKIALALEQPMRWHRAMHAATHAEPEGERP
jgi:hypothetical protein